MLVKKYMRRPDLIASNADDDHRARVNEGRGQGTIPSRKQEVEGEGQWRVGGW